MALHVVVFDGRWRPVMALHVVVFDGRWRPVMALHVVDALVAHVRSFGGPAG
jgi:hypothetical protein